MNSTLAFGAAVWIGALIAFLLWIEWRMSRPLTPTDEECARIDAEIDAAKRRHPSGRAQPDAPYEASRAAHGGPVYVTAPCPERHPGRAR